MSKNAISNEKESVGKIFKKFMHVIGINHRLCKWILPCNLGKNIIMAGLPYVGIVYGCDILNALVEQEAKSNIMSMVYQLLGITFVMTLLYHILDKAGNAMRDSIRYRIKADISGKAASLDYQELESQESMQLLTAALEGEKESGGIYWFSDNSDGNDAIVWMEARGNDSEVCTVLLPDSSTVYLNSQAKLKYPTHFAKERRVYLDGEAYFVVRKQNGKRFIVHTVSEAEVEVLGTEFNVKTNRQGASTTLVSGAVKFISRTADKKERAVLIQPGQKISYDAETGKSKVEEVDIEREIGWKDGKIVLEDCPLQEALDILSKKYHVTFRIINDELQNSRFTGTIKNQGVEQIIKNLSISCRFNYRIVKNNSPGNDGAKATIELY